MALYFVKIHSLIYTDSEPYREHKERVVCIIDKEVEERKKSGNKEKRERK